MNDNDSPKWPNMDGLNSFRQPDPNDAPNTPGIRISNDGYASQATFEDRRLSGRPKTAKLYLMR